MIPAKSAARAIPAVVQAVRLEVRLPPVFDTPTACEPLSAIHFRSLARSLALCHRSSGTLAKHFFTAKFSAGGVKGLLELIGSGSFSKIADATLSWLLPSNARRPVSIS